MFRKEKISNYLNLLKDGDLKELATIIVQYYDLYEVSIGKHEFEFSFTYEDIDTCAEKLSNFFFELENKKGLLQI